MSDPRVEAALDLVRDVPDFPKPGVVFKDLSLLYADAGALGAVVRALAEAGRDGSGAPVVDKVVGVESRGFIFAAPVALELGAGFVPVRKPGKLPRETHSVTYDLEYGQDSLEVEVDSIDPGDRVLIVDDVLATGGTLDATRRLVELCGGEPHAFAVVLELTFLPGRETIGTLPLTSLGQI